MKLKLFILLLSLFSVQNHAKESRQEIRRVGISFQRTNTPYVELSDGNYILPYLKYQKSFWDIEELRGRAKFFNSEEYHTGFQIAYEQVGRGAPSKGVLVELERTYPSIPFGIYHYQKLKPLDFSIELLNSFWGGGNGFIGRLTFIKNYMLFKEIYFRPYFKIEYLSSSYVNYYYGVKEFTDSLEYYNPGAAINYYLGSVMQFSLSKNTYLNFGIKFSKLHGAISQGPIITGGQMIQWDIALSCDI